MDMRQKACFTQEYPPLSQLPTTSVIIIFNNEAVSTLLRTVTSVINMSPPELLEEVCIIDIYIGRKKIDTSRTEKRHSHTCMQAQPHMHAKGNKQAQRDTDHRDGETATETKRGSAVRDCLTQLNRVADTDAASQIARY